jgi:hypothetical protein
MVVKLSALLTGRSLLPRNIFLLLVQLSVSSVSGQISWMLTQRSRVRFTAPPDFLYISGSETGSTQPRKDNEELHERKSSGTGLLN